jgi:2-oxoglutarate dehydrogenase E2 component (dihydrolipoamide succinyltransferase)
VRDGHDAPAAEPRGDDIVPFPRIRARAAPMLVQSKQTAAHALCVVDADYSAIDAARLPERARWRAEEGFALTYLPFVARAFVDALRAHPLLNARVEGDEVVASRAVHLGVAVDLDHEGLVVAVVREAETRSLRGLARAIHDVAGRARDGRLTPDDVGAGTFTITNPGASGTWVSVPVIPRPQVAIVSTDGVAKRVVVDGDAGRAALGVRPMGHLCLSYDAAAVRADEAAAFLAHAREIVEERDWAAEL